MKFRLFLILVLSSACAFGKVSAPSGGGGSELPDGILTNAVESALSGTEGVLPDSKAVKDVTDSKAGTNDLAVAVAGVESNVTDHVNNTGNPHSVTADQVGLGSVNNTSDADKPVSTAQQNALNEKPATTNVFTKTAYPNMDTDSTDDLTLEDLPVSDPVFATVNGTSDRVMVTGTGGSWIYNGDFVITMTGDFVKRSAWQTIIGNRAWSVNQWIGPFCFYIGTDNKLYLKTRYTGSDSSAYVNAADWSAGYQTIRVQKTGTNVVFSSGGTNLVSSGSAKASLDQSGAAVYLFADVASGTPANFYSGRIESITFDATANTAKSFSYTFDAGSGTNITDTINAYDGQATIANPPVFWNWAQVAGLYAPTGSTASGLSGNMSMSSDTNRFLYWFSPTAVSGSTTGVWLRVSGETF